MRSSDVLSFLSVAALASAQGVSPAAPIFNNPIGASYFAELPNRVTTNVRGSVRAESSPDGRGVNFQVAFTGLPTTGGPFMYHLHAFPVPADGNCSGTLAHLDPYGRGQVIPCDASRPETCEVGDLSGKHGQITGTTLSASYNDIYASTLPGIGAFFGNRSIVIHYANSSRITCANFTTVNRGYGGTTGTAGPYPIPSGNATFPNATSLSATAGPTGPAYTTPASPPTPTAPASSSSTGAAAQMFMGTGAMLAAVAAFIL